MAEIKNRYEFLGGILEALDQDYTNADVKDTEAWRAKVLTGLGQEYDTDDLKQIDRWRGKVVAGLEGMSSGGGNPNTFETITGTLANPFGDLNMSELSTALMNKEATAYLDINATALGAGTISSRPSSDGTYFFATGATLASTLGESTAYGVQWYVSDKSLEFARMLNNGNLVDISSYANSLTTTLTIVWHPLAE